MEHDWSWRVHFKTNVKISYVQMPIKLRGIDDVNSLERITFTLHSVKMGDGVNVKIYAYNFKACAWQALPKVYTAIEQKSWCIYCPGEYIHPLTHEVWIRMRIYAETAGEAMRWQYIVVKAYLRGDARDEHAE
ncbi:MAG TPA: hypothetical protein EYP10_12985 [Armatimonadetes bacterium]|nr:hypothetical protein [Armatimonadota bacterium]